jgi:hypothetical protein
MPRLTDEQIEKIYQKIKKESYEFSELYEMSISPKNWNPERPADRERYFIIQYADKIRRAVSQAQYDQDQKELEQAKQETAREIFYKLFNTYCKHFPSFKVCQCKECTQALKSQFIKEK